MKSIHHGGYGRLGDQRAAEGPMHAVGLVGEWPGQTSAKQQLQVGSEVIVRFQTERRAMARLVDGGRFEWIIVGVDQDESILELLCRLTTTASPAAQLRLAGLGDRADGPRCERFMRRGCTVYLDGTRKPASVIGVLASAARFGVSVIDGCFNHSRTVTGPMGPLAALTKTETSVVRLLMRGQSNSEIADVQGIAVSTVESHVRNILSKLGARNRTHAAERARMLGL